MPKMDQAVVLLSGGMDSATLLAHVRSRLHVPCVHALTFDYGQKHACEIAMARWQARAWHVARHVEWKLDTLGANTTGSALTDPDVEIPDLVRLDAEQRRQPATYVPNRNMVFLSLAAAYAESHGMRHVFYGAQAQDEYGYWDCSPQFVEKINGVLALNRRVPIVVHAPFVDRTKAELVEIGRALGVDYAHTWSCYRGGEEPCGECPTCVERSKALGDAGSNESAPARS